MIQFNAISRHQRQKGYATMAISIIILFMMTFIALYAARVGVVEQKISANDYRAEVAFANAEYAVQQGRMLLNANRGGLSSIGTWTECDTNNRAQAEQNNIPCWDDDPNDPTADKQYSNWSYINNVQSINDASSNPLLKQVSNAKGSFELHLLTPNLLLDDNLTDDQDTLVESIVKLYGIGKPDDDIGESVVIQDVLYRPIFGSGPPAPLIASGSVNFGGSFNLIAAPNAGGQGNTLSVWSGGDSDFECEDPVPSNCNSTGTGNSCSLGEYLDSGTVTGLNNDGDNDAENDPFQYCSNCTCPSDSNALGFLSGKDQGNGIEGLDVVDNDPNFPDADSGDLFKYFFNTSKSSFFSNSEKYTEIPDCTATYLDQNTATGIYFFDGEFDSNGDGVDDITTSTCDLDRSGRTQIGGPDNPIALIIADDSSMTARLSNQVIFFGMIYLMQKTTGDVVEINLTGGALIVGSVIAEGEVGIGAGGADIRYDEYVLNNLASDGGNSASITIPGSWTDLL